MSITEASYYVSRRKRLIKILKENLSDDIVKEIGKFTILWAEFEKRYCNNDCNSVKIWDFANSYQVDEKLLRNLSICLKGRVDLYEESVNVYVRYNLVPSGARIPSEKDLGIIQNFIEKDSNLIVGAFLSIYRIRNNLLHGLKCLKELDNQIELFKAMNNVLENIKKKI